MPPVTSPARTAIVPRGSTAIAPAAPAIPPKRPLDPLRLQREYVAAGSPYWYQDAARRLPGPIDDISADFGQDIYERMLRDPQVQSNAQVLKSSIIEDGVYLRPGVEQASDTDYDKAKQVADHLQRVFDEQEVPLDESLFDMLDAPFFGHKVAEVKWEYGRGLSGMVTKALNPVALKVKPNAATSFVCDAYMNVIGLYPTNQWQYGTYSGSQVISPTDPNLLPRSKFAVLTWRPRNGDPRGTSILRAAYDPWWRKRQILVEYMRYLTQFAGPSVIGYTSEAEAQGAQTDPLGNLVVDPNTGEFVQALTPEEQMLSTLLRWRNGLAAAFPFGSRVDVIHPAGNGEAFLKGLAQADQQITKAILSQELATEQSDNMARAAAQVHQDILGTIVRQAKKAVVRMLVMDIMRWWVLWNVGENMEHLIPRPSLGLTEEEDKAPKMNAVAALERAGYLHPSQYPGIDESLGLPARDLSLTYAVDVPSPGQPPADGDPGDPGASRPDSQVPDAPAGGRAGLPPAPAPSPARQVRTNAPSKAAARRGAGGAKRAAA